MDKKGPYKINENKDNKDFILTPSCYGGLLTVSYSLNIKLIFDSILTNNEEFNIPLDFFEKPNNINPNQNNNINLINNINHRIQENNNNINENSNNNNNLKDDNNNDFDAPPPIININENKV